MKKIMLVVSVALLATVSWSCQTGCFEYRGSCACDQKPAQFKQSEDVQPSDEKPPRSGMPAWQDPSVKADDPQSLIFQDAKADKENVQADTEGKLAAGILRK